MNVPDFAPIPGLTAFLTQLVQEMERGQRAAVSTQSATNQMLLYAPGGAVYSLKVDDAGAVSTTKVSG